MIAEAPTPRKPLKAMRVRCWLETFWYSGGGSWKVSGHDYPDPPIYHSNGGIEYEVLICRRCGESSTSWRHLP